MAQPIRFDAGRKAFNVDAIKRSYYDPVARAATDAIKDTGKQAQSGVKANIGEAGFTRRWQNIKLSLRPKRGASINASAHVYLKGLNFAGVFETGAKISGKPLLWLPLPDVPAKISRQRLTPKLFIKLVGPLRSVNRPGHLPMLVARIAIGRRGPGKKTLAKFRAASAANHTAWVPVFVGVTAIQLRKRFNTASVFQKAHDELAEKYAVNIAKLTR